MNKKLYNYANLLIKRGVNVQKGEPLIIQGDTEISYFIEILSEEAYKAGASHVEVIYTNDVLEKLKYQYENIDVLEHVPYFKVDNLMHYLNQGASYIRLSSKDPNNLEGLDLERVKKGTLAYNTAIKDVQAMIMEHKIRWCIAAVPAQKWAELVFPNTTNPIEKLWDAILKCCYADKENPIEAWDNHTETIKCRLAKLNQMNLESLHFTANNGTDIVLGLCDNHIWRGGSSKTAEGIEFSPNIPTYEMYTVPHKDKINGTVISTKPLPYLGNIINTGFMLTYKNGKVVEAKAKSKIEQELLDSIFESYEGSDSLGEVAIVDYNSPINLTEKLFYSTLFDENAACHLAMGNGIATAIEKGIDSKTLEQKGLNKSNTHIDYMIGTSDMCCVGTSKGGAQCIIMKDGEIVI